MIRVLDRRLIVLAVTGGVIALAGCEDLGSLGGGTAILGQAVNPSGGGISGVDVGIVYYTTIVAPPLHSLPAPRTGSAVQGATAPVAAQAPLAAVRLLAPYPNPAEVALDFGDVKIPVEVDADTTIRLEIVETRFGVTATVKTFLDGAISQNTTFSWDGRGFLGSPVPNGLYQVRLTVPATAGGGVTPVETEAALLINRSGAVMTTNLAFNTRTDFDGRFDLEDLAVGALLDATDAAGTRQGRARVRSEVLLLFRHPDYFPKDDQVAIGPGDRVDYLVRLDPLSPAPRPGFASR